MEEARRSETDWEAADIMRGLYGDGIIALPGAFSRAFADRMREDIELLFEEARAVPGGALPRGPERFYVEVQPERIRGFVEIVTHPWFVAVCEAVLGKDHDSLLAPAAVPIEKSDAAQPGAAGTAH